MSTTTAPPLVRGRLATADPELAHEFIRSTYANHTPLLSGDRERFRFQATVVGEQRFAVERVQHSMGLDTDIDPYGDLIIMHIRRGRLRMATPDKEIRASAGDVLLAGPTAPHHVSWNELDTSVMRIGLSALREVAAELTDAPPGRVRFDLCLPLDQARTAHWLGAVNYLSTSVLEVPAAADSTLIRTQAFRTLAIAALNTFPNGTMGVDAGGQLVLPAVSGLVRAIDFIEANAGADISVADIAAAAGVSPRTIQLAFRRHRDVTPMGYLRQVRLRRAHADLLAADPNSTTVTAVAARWGFRPGGGFARVYQQEYGCRPQQTLLS